MARLAFSIAGEPRGKGRPRTRVVKARSGAAFANVYTDTETRKYEAAIKTAAVQAMAGAAPLDGPLTIALRFRFSVPSSFSKAKRARILALQEAYFGAFDADNLAKSLLDGLNGVCFHDDKQALDLLVSKRPHARPGVDIVITPFETERSTA